MAIQDQHPLHIEFEDTWQQCVDGMSEAAIKKAGVKYLPATPGQVADGFDTTLANYSLSKGYKDYRAYLMRAIYPGIYREAIEQAVGAMHREDAVINLPKALEPMRDNCGKNGESLQAMLRHINESQMQLGRGAIMVDVRQTDKGYVPYLSLFAAPDIRNWREIEDCCVDFVALDESGYELNADYKWEMVEQYRITALVSLSDAKDGKGVLDPDGVLATTVLKKDDPIEGAVWEPIYHNDTFIELLNLCLAIYRGEADRRLALFGQAQETLVIKGARGKSGQITSEGDEAIRTGVGAVIEFGSTEGDAKYIGPNGQGLSEQREALETDYERAMEMAGRVVNLRSKTRESGESIKTRMTAQTTNLPRVVKTGAGALEMALRYAAEMVGANPDEVEVIPNLEFTGDGFDGAKLTDLVDAVVGGAPLSRLSLHNWIAKVGITDMSFEDELKQIAKEQLEISESAGDDVE